MARSPSPRSRPESPPVGPKGRQPLCRQPQPGALLPDTWGLRSTANCQAGLFKATEQQTLLSVKALQCTPGPCFLVRQPQGLCLF